MLSTRYILSAILGFSTSALAAVGPFATLTLTNADVAPDGVTRRGIVVNNEFQGPLIKANKGDSFNLNVVNNLNDPSIILGTSIHWHGFFQRGTNWADGAESVNQCPIATNRSFKYTFSAPDQTGTYWYHSHFGTQYCDGLRGPFVIYDPNDPQKILYDVDDDSTVITLSDWYNVTAPNIVGPATSHSTLINGKGRRILGPQAPLSVFTVQPKKRYRFRLVSLSCDPAYTFSIDGHKLKVIEADAQNTKPVIVDQLTIFAGQRYSIVVETNQSPGNFWIRAVPTVPLRDTTTGNPFQNGANSAILRYAGQPAQDPTTSPPTSPVVLAETDLHPLENPAAPDETDPNNIIKLNLAFTFTNGRFNLNGSSYDFPSTPTLLQVLSGSSTPQELLPQGLVFSLPRNKTIEITVPASNTLVGGPHPFHLHGHAFSVVRSAGSTQTNLKDPVRRDVVSIGTPGDQVTIRFRTDNPGPWFFHCHIEFHLAAGLAVVFAEDIPNIEKANPVPPAWDELCDIWNNQKNTPAKDQLDSGFARTAPSPIRRRGLLSQ